MSTGSYPSHSGYVPVRVPLDIEGNTRTAVETFVKQTVGADAVTLEVVRGHPANVSLRLADDPTTTMVVVGSRGHGEFVGALIGSVSQHVATHAPCPVVVTRNPRAA